jgi:hypothetical protein
MSYIDTLPKYYEIEAGIAVKVYAEDGRIVGINHLGNPYDPFKAVRDGTRITEAEFKKIAKL